MLTLGQGLGAKMATVKNKLDSLAVNTLTQVNKVATPAVDAVNSGFNLYSGVNSLIHILHNMF